MTEIKAVTEKPAQIDTYILSLDKDEDILFGSSLNAIGKKEVDATVSDKPILF